MWWGTKPPTPRAICWGARAIYDKEGTFGLLNDRQGFEGGTEVERSAFAKWMDKKGLPKLRAAVKKRCLPANDCERIVVDLDGYRMVASPERSYGYLYIGVYPIAESELNGAAIDPVEEG